jgi:hypothetical protein
MRIITARGSAVVLDEKQLEEEETKFVGERSKSGCKRTKRGMQTWACDRAHIRNFVAKSNI